MRAAGLALGLLGGLVGCEALPPIDFQRMIIQDRFQVWQHCVYFEDGMAMRTPPAGTLPRDAAIGDAGRDTLPVTRARLVAGRASFDAFCAPCHGLRGDGQSVVALNMDLRRPPAIAGEGARALPDDRVYQVITEGYGLMRSYAEDLESPGERWAVVAYLRALQLSQGVPLGSLPPGARLAAERGLP